MALKLKSYQIILIIALAIFAFLIYRAVKFFTAKPNIAVNYVAEWNKISKPENYDPSRNAYFDYEGASDYITEQPPEMYSREIPWPDWPGDMNEAQLKILKDWLEENTKALEYFKTGSQKPYYWDELPEHITRAWEVPLPMLTFIRRCAQAICWRAKLNACENKKEEAFEDILACYRAGILMSGEKRTLMEQLVGAALKSLAVDVGFSILPNAQIDSEKLAEFQKQLEELISERPAKIDFTIEKFIIYDIIQCIFSDDGSGNGRLIASEARKVLDPFLNSTKPQPRSFLEIIGDLFSGISGRNKGDNIGFVQIALMGPDRKEHAEAIERVHKFYEDIQDKSPRQIHNTGINPSGEVDDVLKNYRIIQIFTPDIYRLNEINYRQRTSEDAFLTVIAALRFKAEKGKYPDSLQELVDAGYLKELPIDPYNDGPLTYKKTENGFLLYSFGADFDDDGGAYSDWGENSNGGDQVFWPIEKKTK